MGSAFVLEQATEVAPDPEPRIRPIPPAHHGAIPGEQSHVIRDRAALRSKVMVMPSLRQAREARHCAACDPRGQHQRIFITTVILMTPIRRTS